MASIRLPARTFVRCHVRRLHITGANSTPSKILVSEPKVSQAIQAPSDLEIASRHFNTSRSLKAVNDSSTIDFAYMPQLDLVQPSQTEVMRIPLLPDNFFPPRRSHSHQEAMEPVIRPEISTASADGTHNVSAMSEVTDNHAMELDPYDLTTKVNMSAAKMYKSLPEQPKAHGMIQTFWNGLLDDLLGAKKLVKA